VLLTRTPFRDMEKHPMPLAKAVALATVLALSIWNEPCIAVAPPIHSPCSSSSSSSAYYDTGMGMQHKPTQHSP
jgi:hypothetical protein